MSETLPREDLPEAIVEELALQIISYAGEGKAKVAAAVEAFGNGDDAGFEKLLKEAEAEFDNAHRAQVRYLQKMVLEIDTGTPVLLVHAMDILMTAASEKDLVVMLVKAFNARSKQFQG